MKLQKNKRPRKPGGRWIYYLLYQDIIWPCPVRWEWEAGYGGWLPYYYAPTLEFVAADPRRVTKVRRGAVSPDLSANVRHEKKR